MLFNLAAAADALEDLFDHERRLILAGEIDGLIRISSEKERLLTRLAASDNPPEVMQNLRHKAERNQNLLAAAARGIKSAARRIETMGKADSGLRTYGRDGSAANLSRGRGGIDRQA